MITPSQLPSSRAIAQGKGSAPYAGPERRIADRRRADDTSARAGGYQELGPYLPSRGRSSRRTPVAHVPALVPVAIVDSPVTGAVTFEVLDEDFVMAEAILAEPEPRFVPQREVSSEVSSEVASEVSSEVSSNEFTDTALTHAEEADAAITVAPPRARDELPWITAFLDDIPERPEQDAIEAELWPLDDAGSRMCELAHTLEPHTATDQEPNEHVVDHAPVEQQGGPSTVAPLAMWSDDDFVDVMPVHVTSLPREVVLPQVTTALVAPTSETVNGRESAALALEALAGRVRRGEVESPALDTELGDAAALANALVFLLAPRR